MTFLLLSLLLLPATRVDVVDEVFDIPPSEWRYVQLNLNQQPVAVMCQFEASRGRQLRLALVGAEDLARMRDEQPHGMAAVTGRGSHGHMRYTVRAPGEYFVVVDNRGDASRATVRLRVWLDFAPVAEPAARTLSFERRAAVVAISCVAFFGIVGFTGRRLLRGLRR